MFQPWRLKLREAQVALDSGRLDEASRILADRQLREFLPAKKLLARLADRFVKRGTDRIVNGESSAGWRDLEVATQLGADGRKLGNVKEEAAGRALEKIVEQLTAGDAAGAREQLTKLARRDRTNGAVRQLERVVRNLEVADAAIRRGRFSEATAQLAEARAVRPDLRLLERRQADVSLKANRYRELTLTLHEALRSEDWSRVLDCADQVLAISPDDLPARQARQRAWRAAEIRLQASVRPAAAPLMNGLRRGEVTPEADNSGVGTTGARFLLWVDEVGGYLVCLSNEVLLGQPVQGSAVDVPLLADLSRRHAKIRRAGEGYVLEAIRESRVNGRPVSGVRSLADGDLIELADRVQLRFRQSHPLSTTARLEFVSPHRTQPSVDAILLMADACILGSSPGSHVCCPGWTREVVLYHQGGCLGCRTEGTWQVDGREVSERAEVTDRSTIAGDDFSMTLEPL
ncbi:MAG: hypothetical protein K2Y37_18425 [Pirellulales bacterium]|nr:hypothetical protein [Pirellulales bacterium]